MSRFTPGWALGLLLMVASLPVDAAKGPQACTLRYTLTGWSLLYSTASGTGKVACEGGRTLAVKIRIRGAGLSFGRQRTITGHGRFNGVYRIRDVLGGYTAVDVHAGAHRSGAAHVMTNGPVKLRMVGKGRGWDLGFSVGKVTLSQ